ncbi:hypothetical protein BC832DRAFT_564050 [Gaertneriomyces semiglobifer]|nr:hypothetical protein BC832DRAFT_564050 [Gaertneriomyces semiglobifer]
MIRRFHRTLQKVLWYLSGLAGFADLLTMVFLIDRVVCMSARNSSPLHTSRYRTHLIISQHKAFSKFGQPLTLGGAEKFPKCHMRSVSWRPSHRTLS